MWIEKFIIVSGASHGSGKLGRATPKVGPAVDREEAGPGKGIRTTSAGMGGTKTVGLGLISLPCLSFAGQS